MSSAGFDIAFELSRARLLELVQTHMHIQGISLAGAFRLAAIENGRTVVDAVVRGVSLSLDPGTDFAHLMLHAAGMRVSLPGIAPVSFQDSQVDVVVRLRKGTPLAAAFQSANARVPVDARVAGIRDFFPRVNAALTAMLEPHPVELFPRTQGLVSSLCQFKLQFVYCVDAETVCVLGSGGDPRTKTASIANGADVALSVSDALLSESVVCRALQERYQGGNLPPPCGGGEIVLSQNQGEIRIDRLRFDFDTGHVGVSGSFRGSGQGYEIGDGSFSQRLAFDLDRERQTLMPCLEPPQPRVSCSVQVDHLTRAAAATVNGGLEESMTLFTSGVAALLSAEISRGLIGPNPALAPARGETGSSVGGVQWTALDVVRGGLCLQGSCRLPPLPATAQPDVAISVQTQVRGRKHVGDGTYKFPGSRYSEPREFYFREYQQYQQFLLQATPVLLLQPVTYEWLVSGAQAPLRDGTAVAREVAVRAATPPPDGCTLPVRAVQLMPTFLTAAHDQLMLQSREIDLNYDVQVEVSATDAAGRVFRAALRLEVRGHSAEFGPEFEQYRDQHDMATRVALSWLREKPDGVPRDGRVLTEDDLVAIARAAIREGAPNVDRILAGIVRTHGARILGRVFSRDEHG